MGIIKTSIKSFIFNILGSGLGLLFQILAAKFLGANIYGQANYYYGYCSTLYIFACFGLQTYLSKKIPEVRDKNKLFSEVVST